MFRGGYQRVVNSVGSFNHQATMLYKPNKKTKVKSQSCKERIHECSGHVEHRKHGIVGTRPCQCSCHIKSKVELDPNL